MKKPRALIQPQILVVTDTSTWSSACAAELLSAQCSLVRKMDFGTALSLFDNAHRWTAPHYHAVVCDYELEDGYANDMLRQVRRAKHGARLPFVIYAKDAGFIPPDILHGYTTNNALLLDGAFSGARMIAYLAVQLQAARPGLDLSGFPDVSGLVARRPKTGGFAPQELSATPAND